MSTTPQIQPFEIPVISDHYYSKPVFGAQPEPIICEFRATGNGNPFAPDLSGINVKPYFQSTRQPFKDFSTSGSEEYEVVTIGYDRVTFGFETVEPRPDGIYELVREVYVHYERSTYQAHDGNSPSTGFAIPFVLKFELRYDGTDLNIQLVSVETWVQEDTYLYTDLDTEPDTEAVTEGGEDTWADTWEDTYVWDSSSSDSSESSSSGSDSGSSSSNSNPTDPGGDSSSSDSSTSGWQPPGSSGDGPFDISIDKIIINLNSKPPFKIGVGVDDEGKGVYTATVDLPAEMGNVTVDGDLKGDYKIKAEIKVSETISATGTIDNKENWGVGGKIDLGNGWYMQGEFTNDANSNNPGGKLTIGVGF